MSAVDVGEHGVALAGDVAQAPPLGGRDRSKRARVTAPVRETPANTPPYPAFSLGTTSGDRCEDARREVSRLDGDRHRIPWVSATRGQAADTAVTMPLYEALYRWRMKSAPQPLVKGAPPWQMACCCSNDEDRSQLLEWLRSLTDPLSCQSLQIK